MLIGNLGSVLAGAPLSALAQATGWRGVFIGVGVALAGAGACAGDCARSSELWRRTRRGGPKFDRTAVLNSLLAVVRNRDTWPAVLVNTGMSAAPFFTFAGLWATPYLMQVHGMDRVRWRHPFVAVVRRLCHRLPSSSATFPTVWAGASRC
jgi:predicted MFS family arabinose efflux permease